MEFFFSGLKLPERNAVQSQAERWTPEEEAFLRRLADALERSQGNPMSILLPDDVRRFAVERELRRAGWVFEEVAGLDNRVALRVW